MSSLIKPTVGRVVLFMPGAAAHISFAKPSNGEPCAALVTRVWGDRCINIAAFDANGTPFGFTSVRLLQGDDVAREGEMHAKWMDYQKGQAAKAEQLEAKLATAPVLAAEAAIEAEIVAKGLTAPRVTLEQIDALMARVTYTGGRVSNTTSTVVHAFLDGEFLLASGHSACVSATNYDADIGFKLARGNAEKKARDQLWQLEGYALRKRLHECAHAPLQAPPPVDNAHVAPGCEPFTGTAVGLSFGDALEVLKAGGKVARAGWNGKGMWLSLTCNGTREVAAENFWSSHNAEHARSQGGKAKVLPSITMKTATGEILMGWLASQTDMLADDWQALDVEVLAT